jgi:hypothetical protein
MSRSEHFMLGAGHAVPEIAAAATRYAAGVGSNYRRPASYGGIVTTPQMQQSLAEAYHRLPLHDPAAEPAFHAMRKETVDQFHHLTAPRSRGGMGINVEVGDKDPYSGPQEMFHDLFRDRRMKVLSTRTTGEHPFFSDDENDMFRAVHDVFGHAGTGRGFDRHGEEAAYQSHASMYSPLARMALATETRGQNAALITGGGAFAPQKVALLPKRLVNPGLILGTPESKQVARTQAQTFNQAQFGTLLGALKQTT